MTTFDAVPAATYYATKTQHDVPIAIHQGFATVVLLYSLFLGIWGLFLYLRGSNPSGGYLGALVLLEAVAVLQVLIGLLLLVLGHRPHDAFLHYLYGVIAVVTLPTAYFYGDGGRERRDSLIFGLAGFLLVGVAIRSMMTGGT